MATATLISVAEYLASTYHPDREYLDGELIERNMGESDHSFLQGLIFSLLFACRKESGIHVYPELRTQISGSRFRIPDIAVTTSKIKGRILREPPFLCVEVLSPEDRATRLEAKIAEYFQFGVAHVWVIDPRSRRAWNYTRHGRTEALETLETHNPSLQVSVKQLFHELDDDLDLTGEN